MSFSSSRWPRRLARFWPPAAQVGHLERWRAGCFAVLGIAITAGVTQAVIGAEAVPWLVASMGASSVIVFGLPHSPLGQPWPLVGGQVISAIVGVACVRYLPSGWPVAGIAVGAAIVAMHYSRSLHPPGGAAALTAVIGGDSVQQLGFGYALVPVGLNALLLLLVALATNNAVRGRRYPAPRENERKPANARVGEADWEAALGRAGEVVDVTPEALLALAAEAERHALARQPGAPRCRDLAQPDSGIVAPEASLSAIWATLEEHGEVAVVDGEGRVLGALNWQQLFDAGPASRRLEAVADLLLRRAGEPVSTWMRTAPTVAAVAPWTALLEPLQSRDRVYVIDEAQRLLGSVRAAKLLALYPPQKGVVR